MLCNLIKRFLKRTVPWNLAAYKNTSLSSSFLWEIPHTWAVSSVTAVVRSSFCFLSFFLPPVLPWWHSKTTSSTLTPEATQHSMPPLTQTKPLFFLTPVTQVMEKNTFFDLHLSSQPHYASCFRVICAASFSYTSLMQQNGLYTVCRCSGE